MSHQNYRIPTKPQTHKIPVRTPDPYPPARVEAPNPVYAQMLQENMAASRGELTSIHQYLYQNWILEEGYEDFPFILLQIAEIEMHHLQLFGELIVLLGGDPRYNAASFPADPNRQTNPRRSPPVGRNFRPQRAYWNGGMVNYTHDIREILTNNVLLELSAIETYTQQAKSIEDDHLSAILMRIAQDEIVHKGIFESYLTRLPG